MKKQKKPIILILLLALLVGGAAFMNKGPSSPEQPTPQPSAKEAEPESKEKVGGDVAKQMKEDKPAPPPEASVNKPRKPGMPGFEGPSIIKRKIAPYKPKPNDSATSTQWYTEASPRK